MEYHVLLAHDLQLMRDEDYKGSAAGVVEVKRMLASMVTSLCPQAKEREEFAAARATD